MRITCPRKTMAAAVKMAVAACASKPPFDKVILSVDSGAATFHGESHSMRQSIVLPEEETTVEGRDGTWALDAGRLQGILKLSGPSVTVSTLKEGHTSGDDLAFSVGRSAIQLRSIATMPPLDEEQPQAWSPVDGQLLAMALKACSHAQATTEDRWELQGVHLSIGDDRLICASTDRSRVFCVDVADAVGSAGQSWRVTIPGQLVGSLVTLGLGLGVSLGLVKDGFGKPARLHAKSASGVSLSGLLIAAEYPPYDRVLRPQDNRFTVVVSRGELAECAEAAKALGHEACVMISPSAENLSVVGRAREGHVTTILDTRGWAAHGGADAEVSSVAADYLAQALSAMALFDCHFVELSVTRGSPLLVKGMGGGVSPMAAIGERWFGGY